MLIETISETAFQLTLCPLKPLQNKKDQNFFLAAPFVESFSTAGAAEKNYSKNSAARTFFGPSYFDPTLGSSSMIKEYPCLVVLGFRHSSSMICVDVIGFATKC